MNNETLHWHKVTGKQKEQVLGFHIFFKQKREKNINAQKLIGGKKQRDHVTKDDLSSHMVLEEAAMRTCVTNAQDERDVAVASIPNACAQKVTSDDSKECLSALRSKAMRPCDGLQVTQQSQSQVVDWHLRCPCRRKTIITGIGCRVNTRSFGTCGGTKLYKSNNISVIYGAGDYHLAVAKKIHMKRSCRIIF